LNKERKKERKKEHDNLYERYKSDITYTSISDVLISVRKRNNIDRKCL